MSEQLYLLSFPGATYEQVEQVREVLQERVNESDVPDAEVVIVAGEVESVDADELREVLDSDD